jgi:hypothetical protein
MFINKNQWLSRFKKSDISFDEFIDNALVKSKTKIFPLKELIIIKKINKSKIKKLYEHYINKDTYLSNFYDTSLQIPDDLTISQTPMKNQFNNSMFMKCKNVIRNLHYLDILKYTQSGFNNPNFLTTLDNFYNKLILDYNLIIPSTLEYIQNSQISGVFSSMFFRASIMNPFLVYSLNHSLFKASKVFTPTLGWSSYCYGFLECEYIKEYVGTDVIPSVCKKTKMFANKFYKDKITNIYCSPSESLLHNSNFIQKYSKHFDLVFFSPPYYKLELYQSKQQSTNNYDSYDKWLSNYWEQTILLCHKVLTNGGKLCYILSGYGKDLKFDLANDMNQITKKYFKHFKTIDMLDKKSNKKHRTTNEQIFIFVK